MSKIDIKKLPKEITDKYSVSKNTFFSTPQTNPKDKIEIEVGDFSNTDFILTANIPNVTDYKDAGGVIVCRVFQLDI